MCDRCFNRASAILADALNGRPLRPIPADDPDRHLYESKVVTALGNILDVVSTLGYPITRVPHSAALEISGHVCMMEPRDMAKFVSLCEAMATHLRNVGNMVHASVNGLADSGDAEAVLIKRMWEAQDRAQEQTQKTVAMLKTLGAAPINRRLN